MKKRRGSSSWHAWQPVFSLGILPTAHSTPLLCCRTMWNVDSTCQELCSNMFPHSDKCSTQSQIPDPSHLAAALLFNKPPWIPATKPDLTLILPSLSDGISWEPAWPGCEGRAKGKKAAQGGGELHVEHHHTEGEILRLYTCCDPCCLWVNYHLKCYFSKPGSGCWVFFFPVAAQGCLHVILAFRQKYPLCKC